VRQHVGGTSKSGREAVVLKTGAHEYILRREAGNPFFDSVLDGLVGKELSFRGRVDGVVFTVAAWKDLDR